MRECQLIAVTQLLTTENFVMAVFILGADIFADTIVGNASKMLTLIVLTQLNMASLDYSPNAKIPISSETRANRLFFAEIAKCLASQ